MRMLHRVRQGLAIASVLALTVITAHGESPTRRELLAALRSGGYIILMRHTSSPRDRPDRATANADNANLERQLDAPGQLAAREMGDALRRLRIPIGQVLSSPSYRALETVKCARLGTAITLPQLGDSGQSMSADKSGTRAVWLKTKSAEPPPHGKNTLIVTHFPNILEAYPQTAAGLADGEALILHPDGRGNSSLVTRIRIDEWPRLDSKH